MIVGAAEVRVSPEASGFGAKTQAAIKAALAGVKANVEITLDSNALRTKMNAAVKAATRGIEAKVGTDVDTSPITKKVAKAIKDATAAAVGGEGQLDLFDLDPAKFVAEVNVAKEAARASLAAGKQLELDLKFNAENANAVLRSVVAGLSGLDIEKEIKIDVDRDFTDGDRIGDAIGQAVQRGLSRTRLKPPPIDSGGGKGGGGDADRVGAAAGGIFGRAVLRSAGAVLAAGGLAQIFTAATSGAVAIGGALISATGAAGSLASTAASLPALFSAAAQAAASIGFALGGVGGALKAFGAMEKAVGKAAAGGGGDSGASARNAERAVRDATRGVAEAERSMADAIESATERAADAVRGLEDAQRDAAETAETAARRVIDAEENLADAHRRVQSAQEDLTQARRDAVAEIADLRDSVESLALSEEDAALRVAEAQQRIREGQRGTSAHPVLGEDVTKVNLADRQRAERDALALRRAQLSLVEATKRRIEAQEKLNKAEAEGVDGNQKVIDATERLEDARRRETDAIEENTRAQRDAARSIVDANQRVIDAQAEVGKSQRDLTRAQTDGAERVALAQERLADAIADSADRAAGGVSGVAGATDAYEAALARLSAPARQFVEFLVGLQPRLRQVQATAAAGLFPGLETSIRTLLPVVDDLEPIIGDTAKALGDLSVEGANLVASPGFRGDLVTIGKRNIDILTGLGRAAISGVSSLRHLTIAAGPLTQHLVDLTQNYALLIERTLATARANGSLEAFFGRVSGRIDRLLVTIGFLGTGLFRIFRDATPAGDRYFDLLTRLAAKFDILTERATKSGALREFFDGLEPAVTAIARLLGDVATGLFKIGTANLGSFTVFVDQLRTEFLPVLLEVLGAIDTDFLSALVSLATGFASLFGAFLNGNPTLTLFVGILGDMASAISTLLTDIPILSPILQGLVTVFGALAVVGAVSALKNFASTIFGVERALITMTGSADAAALAGTRVGAAYNAAGVIIGKAFLIAGVIFAAKQAIDALYPSIDKLTSSVLRAKDPAAEFEKQLQKIAKPGFLQQTFDVFSKFFGAGGGKYGEGLENAIKKTRDFETASIEGFRSIASASAVEGQKIIDRWKSQGRATEDYERILEEVIVETAKAGIAEDEVTQRVADHTRALQSNNDQLKEHADRMRRSADAALSLSGATIGMEQAFDDLTAAVEKDTTAFDINEQVGRDAKRGLDSYVGSIQDAIDKLRASADAGFLDAESKQRILENLERLATSGYPGAQEQARRLREELETIQQTYTANVDLDTTRAVAKVDDLIVRLRYLEAVGVSAENNANLGTAGDPDAREFGGRVMRNAAYIVGEKRPELFIPDQNGVILPQVPDISDPTVLSAAAGTNLGPSIGNFDMEGLEAALRRLEETLTEQLAQSQAEAVRPRPEPPTAPSEQPVATSGFDYDAMAAALNRLGSRTVNINTQVSSAMPGEVGIDTARNLRNAVYLEMGD